MQQLEWSDSRQHFTNSTSNLISHLGGPWNQLNYRLGKFAVWNRLNEFLFSQNVLPISQDEIARNGIVGAYSNACKNGEVELLGAINYEKNGT